VWKENALRIRRIVLLPGMDGTGELFTEFTTLLPEWLASRTVSYPPKVFLPYRQLQLLLQDVIPTDEPFVLLAESFSTPLAVTFAAGNPPNLAALVVCAGFVSSPVRKLTGLLKPLVNTSIFKLRPPQWFLEHFLLGNDAPAELIKRLRETVQSVQPEVLSGRLREVLDCDARAELAQLKVPTLCLQPTNDRLLAASCGEEFRRLRPEIEFVTISAPHAVLQREPRKAVEAILSFIAAIGDEDQKVSNAS
jgi:pimeloyl-[acyl-carrier protein] methyl ester esterase